MPSLQRALFAVVFVLLVMYQPTAALADVEYSVPDTTVLVSPDESMTVSMTITPDETMQLSPRVRINSGNIYSWTDFYLDDQPGGVPVTVPHTIPAEVIALACTNGSFELMLEVVQRVPGQDAESLGQETWSYTCVGQEPEPQLIIPDPALFQIIEQHCGDSNDEVFYAQGGVTVTGYAWSGNNYVATLQANEGFTFAEGTTTTVTYTDPGDCVIDAEVPRPTQIDVCGPLNDEFRQDGELPEGVDSNFSISSSGAEIIVTYAAIDGYTFSDGKTLSFAYTDENTPCAPEATIWVNVDDTTFIDIPPTGTEVITATIEIAAGHPYSVQGQATLVLDPWEISSNEVASTDTGFVITFHVPKEDMFHTYCLDDGQFTVVASASLTDGTDTTTIFSDAAIAPCSFADDVTIISPELLPPTVTEVCGEDNDEVIPAETQPEGVNPTPEISEWSSGVKTLTYAPAEGFAFADEFDPVISITDENVPCILVTPTGELDVIQVCGTHGMQQNDIVTLVPQEGVVVDRTGWTNFQYDIHVVPAEGYAFTEGAETHFFALDANTECEASSLVIDETSDALLNRNEGDVIWIPAMLTPPQASPFNSVEVETHLPVGDPVDFSTSLTIASGDPVQVDVQYTIPTGFYDVCAENGGRMPVEMVAELVGPNGDGASTPFEEMVEASGSLLCGAIEVVPDVALVEQHAVCGPNNDTFSIEQEGVEVSLGDWTENTNTLTFAPAEGYVFPDGAATSVAVTDEDVPCSEIPDGKTLTVVLQTSDKGSIEGTPYQLFAPVASQIAQPPYAEGVVGPDNRIVFEELIAGDYRLVVSAEGYEPIDSLLAVTDGTDPQEIIIAVAAIQVEPTPTSEPTSEPTVEPTVVPTIEPTVEPTPDPTLEPTQATADPTLEPTQATADPTATAGVSSLPETGSGPGNGATTLGIAGLLAAAIVMLAIGSRRFD